MFKLIQAIENIKYSGTGLRMYIGLSMGVGDLSLQGPCSSWVYGDTVSSFPGSCGFE